ncbi:MAG: phosphoheptose isomerase [Idiomarina sp.]|uniref:DnaA-interacting protein DiaA n=1 Tax=Idiomarina aquatica TaxID=1327752 RepID=A0A4R6P984_9GAMM|nr:MULTISPECIES: SIS domain-containing protein [Idiomarina]MAK72362.1 phosphoheptose isomerase [Idiomarinaceae bacterium]MBL4742897.1 SIS domain-containing protein [Idiomarina sp.]MBT42072.1 phosphoheptose isomerase [Idiomarina sp.]PHQ73097.1 MAG: phosphoheptose isomerase [Idiomarina sp.]TDP32699.1 DnaA-interacting protein DiaA [Idiomarina aquatica]
MQSEQVKTVFTESIQTQISAVESLSDMLEDTVGLLVNSLLNGQRLFVQGNASCRWISRHFAEQMNSGMRLERPAFPVIPLQNYGHQQVASLGQRNDILVVIAAAEGDDKALLETMEVALSREMIIVALTGQNNELVSGLLGADDIEIQIPSQNPARVLEHQLLICHCLCELIEQTIFPQEHD